MLVDVCPAVRLGYCFATVLPLGTHFGIAPNAAWMIWASICFEKWVSLQCALQAEGSRVWDSLKSYPPTTSEIRFLPEVISMAYCMYFHRRYWTRADLMSKVFQMFHFTHCSCMLLHSGGLMIVHLHLLCLLRLAARKSPYPRPYYIPTLHPFASRV